MRDKKLVDKDPDLLVNERFILQGKATAPEVYVDGASQILVGYPMTKIYFHSVVNHSDTQEKRKVVQVLTLSTTTAIELANLILSVAKKSNEFLLPMSQSALDQLQTLISDIDEIKSDNVEVAKEDAIQISTKKRLKSK